MATQQTTREWVLPKINRLALSRPAALVVGMGLALILWAAWALAGFASIREAGRYYLRGETLFIDSVTQSFGSAAPREEVSVSFRLTNRGKEIRILGCQTYCNCMLPRDLPFALAPNETRDFTLLIRMPGPEYARTQTPARLQLRFVLYTNNPAQSRIPLLISGDIRE